MNNTRLMGLAALVSLASVLSAQEAQGGFEFSSSGFVAGRSDVTHSKLKGSAESRGWDMKASYAFEPGIEGAKLRVGLGYDVNTFDYKGALPLPEKLENFSLPLSYSHKIDSAWTALLMASPSWRGAEGELKGDSFSVPLMAGALYAPSRTLQCMIGVAHDPFSEYSVIPAGGVSWAFDPQWRLSVGYPKTALTYSFTRQISLSAGVSMEAGSYWVKETPTIFQIAVVGVEPIPTYKDTYLSYRELRAGLDLDVRVTDSIDLSLSGGSALDRKWKYHEKDYQLDGKQAWYVKASVKLRF